MKETLSWDLPIPNKIAQNFQVVYTRKLNGVNCIMRHDFSTGYDIIISPTKIPGAAMHNIYNESFELTPEQEELIRQFTPLLKNYYIGDEVVATDDEDLFQALEVTHCIKMRQAVRECFIQPYEGGLVLRLFRFTAHVPEPGEICTTKEVQRIFISNGVIWNEYPTAPGQKWIWEEKNIKVGFSNLLYRYRDTIYCEEGAEDLFMRSFPDFRVAGYFKQWFRFYPVTRKNNKFQKTVDQMNALVDNTIPAEVKDFYRQEAESNVRREPYCKGSLQMSAMFTQSYAYFEEISETLSVIRMFTLNLDYKGFEYARLFIGEDNVYPCYYSNGVVSECKSMHRDFWEHKNPVNIKVNKTILAKICPWLENYTSYNMSMAILNLLSIQSLEDLGKMGFEKAALYIADDWLGYDQWIKELNYVHKTKKSSLKDLMGSDKVKEMFWVSKNYDFERFLHVFNLVCSLNVHEKEFYQNLSVDIPQVTMNESLFKSILIDMDKVLSGSQMVEFEKEFIDQFKWYNAHEKSVYNRYNFDGDKSNAFDFDDEEDDEDMGFPPVSCLSEQYFDLYRLISYVYGDNAKEFRRIVKHVVKLRSAKAIRKMHDDLSMIQRLKDVDEEEFLEMCSQHKDVEFENDQFSIRLPNSPAEVIAEGNEMHHCVASYLDSVVDGSSVIVFLRKQKAPEKSFITMELDGRNNLKQVKCKCNNFVEDPDVLNFLTAWKQEKEIIPATTDIIWKETKFHTANQFLY